MIKHTGPTKLQMKPPSKDSQQLDKGKETSSTSPLSHTENLRFTHLLFVSTVSRWFNDGRQNDDNKRHPVASDAKVERPNGGVEHEDHHTVQLHSF